MLLKFLLNFKYRKYIQFIYFVNKFTKKSFFAVVFKPFHSLLTFHYCYLFQMCRQIYAFVNAALSSCMSSVFGVLNVSTMFLFSNMFFNCCSVGGSLKQHVFHCEVCICAFLSWNNFRCAIFYYSSLSIILLSKLENMYVCSY